MVLRIAVPRTMLLAACLVAIPVVLTWRQVRQTQLNHALFLAVNHSDAAAVRHLLRRGADPNACFRSPEDSQSPWQRFWNTLRHRPSLRTMISETPLMDAVAGRFGSDGDTARIMDDAEKLNALAAAGADVNCPVLAPVNSFIDPSGPIRLSPWLTNPLVWAATRRKWQHLEILLAYKAEVNRTDVNGTTALMMAASSTKPDIVEALLRRGANVNAVDFNGCTALYYAINRVDDRVENVRATVGCLLRYGASIKDKKSGKELTSYMDPEIRHDGPLIRMFQQAAAREHRLP